MNEEILDLKLKGYCCSQMIMEMGLKRMGKTNDDLVAASAGLCDGMWSGRVCGILSAAICLLYLVDAKEADREWAEELTDWFEDTFEYLDCKDLMEGNPLNKVEKCPMMLEATFQKIEELLEWD